MEQDQFIVILRKYLQGDATPSEKKIIDAWYASMKDNAGEHDLPTDEALEKYYRKAIHPHIRKSNLNGNGGKFFPWMSGIAASLLIGISCYFFFTRENAIANEIVDKKEIANAWKEIEGTRHTQTIILPDSSKVILQPGGHLKYSAGFNESTREVHLEGEASFEVTHNPDVPFLVYANEVTTRVLGTSFNIRAIKDEGRVTVVVKTGKVSVHTPRDSKKDRTAINEIILTPNQQVVYDKKQQEVSRSLVEKPRVIIPQEELRYMRFEEAPVTEIFLALEKAYGVDIEFDEELFSSCELTTVISNDDIYSRLDIICDALGTSYVRENDRIVVSSSGCKTRY